MSLKQKILEKARKPMQEAGVYDSMEQAGYADMISVDYVLKLLDEFTKQIQQKCTEEITKPIKFKDDVPFREGYFKAIEEILAVLDGKEKQTESRKEKLIELVRKYDVVGTQKASVSVKKKETKKP